MVAMVIHQTRKAIFLTSGKRFLRNLVQHRRRLIALGNTSRDHARCFIIIDNILRHINFRILENPRSLSIYFINNQENIRFLIGESDHRRGKQLDEFLKLSSVYKIY